MLNTVDYISNYCTCCIFIYIDLRGRKVKNYSTLELLLRAIPLIIAILGILFGDINYGVCLAEEKPQGGQLVLWAGLLDAGQRRGLPAGDQGTPKAAGRRHSPVYHFPHRGPQQKARRNP